MKKNCIIYFWVANHHQSLQYVSGGKMVAMNHKIKQCNCFKGDDKLGFLDDFTKACFYEFGLWSLYTITWRWYY
jgi:hypothetical protein